jgi:hypothetical protein
LCTSEPFSKLTPRRASPSTPIITQIDSAAAAMLRCLYRPLTVKLGRAEFVMAFRRRATR